MDSIEKMEAKQNAGSKGLKIQTFFGGGGGRRFSVMTVVVIVVVVIVMSHFVMTDLHCRY